MTVDLDRRDIINLLRGTTPRYVLMRDIPQNFGRYKGGFNDCWVWDISANYESDDTKKYPDEYLYNLYLKCKTCWD